ncbi:MAG: hypothetical protein ACREFI_03185 [Stellaceae bacterium]
MKAKLRVTKRALVLSGLVIGTVGIALTPGVASARNFIGVDVGPLSVGIGGSEPDYHDSAPAPAPATTYVAPAPSTTYVEPAPQTDVAPAPVTDQSAASTHQAPASTETSTTTYYNYPNETTTYDNYRPSLVPRASETQTIYYPQ